MTNGKSWRRIGLALSTQPDPIEFSSAEVQAIVKDFAQGGPILISNTDLEETQNGNGFGSLATRLSRGRHAGCPLLVRRAIIREGEHHRRAGSWGVIRSGACDDQVKVIVASANQAAIAIENHRLYQQIREAVMSEERNRLARDLHDSVTQVALLSHPAGGCAAANLAARSRARTAKIGETAAVDARCAG